jgi:hypothetical protein
VSLSSLHHGLGNMQVPVPALTVRAYFKSEGDSGQGASEEAHRRPAAVSPRGGGARRSHGAADEHAGHEDRVQTASGFRTKGVYPMLVRHQGTLHAKIQHDDPDDQSLHGVPQTEHQPGRQRQNGAKRDDQLWATPVGELTGQRGGEDADCADDAEQPGDIRPPMKRRFFQVERQDCPEGCKGREQSRLHHRRTAQNRLALPEMEQREDRTVVVHSTGPGLMAWQRDRHHSGGQKRQRQADPERGAPAEMATQKAGQRSAEQYTASLASG